MGLELLREVMDRNIDFGGVSIETIVNALGVNELVKGDHVRWKLEKVLHQS